MSDTSKSPAAGACAGCGAALVPGTPEGLCPRCLLGGALQWAGSDSEPPTEEDPLASLLEGRVIANYEIIRIIARGGMGAVFRARQRGPDRIVALKVIAAGELATQRMVERFRTEGEAAAKLGHPNIVPIYEVGHDAGWHFISMRLIEGDTLGDAIAVRTGAQGFPPKEAALLLIKIAQAVHHAHQRGVLHRDLKPNNILLDAGGEPHLTDFGVAKMLEGSVELTKSNVALGTPAYMAPEQAAGGRRDMTVSVDIYGLGAVFYEMLTGRPPFEAPTTHALLRMVAEDDPVPPSQVQRARRKSAPINVSKAAPDPQRSADQPGVSAAATLALFADLDAICLKCLEKEPALRFRSAEQLADDLDRAVRGEAIAAKPSTATQRVRKWARRNPTKVALIASVTSLLLMGSAVSTWQAIRATRAEREQSRLRLGELELRRQAERRSYAADINLAQQTLVQNNVGRARDLLLRYQPGGGAGRSAPAVEQTMRPDPSSGARGTTRPASPDFTRAERQHFEDDLRGWEWRYLWQHTRSDADHEITKLARGIHSISISVSADGRYVAAGQGEGGALKVVDRESRAELVSLETNYQRVSTAFSPREPRLAFTWSEAPGNASVQLLNVVTRKVEGVIRLPQPALGLQFSDDGQRLLVALQGPDAQLTLWRVADQQLLARVPSNPDPKVPVVATPDLNGVFESIAGGKIRLVDLRTGETRWSVQASEVGIESLALSPDHTIVASAASITDPSIRLWAADSGRELGRLDGHVGHVHDVKFLADGKTLVSASADQTLRLWDVAKRRAINVLRGHRHEVFSLALLPDQRTLLSSAKDLSILSWDLERSRQPRGLVILRSPAVGYAFTADSSRIWLGERTGQISEWSGPDFRERRVLHQFDTNIFKAVFSPDHHLVAVQFYDRRVSVWDLRNDKPLADFSLPPDESYIKEFDASGNRLCVDNYEGKEQDHHIFDLRANRIEQSWRVKAPHVEWTGFSADQRQRIALGSSGVIVVRDLDARTNAYGSVQIDFPSKAALSPDGGTLAACSMLGYVRLWDWPSRREITTLTGFLTATFSVLFSPDGNRLIVGSDGHEAVKVWDLATYRELITLPGEGLIFSKLSLSPDGNMLGALPGAGILHVWRAPSFAEIEAETK